MSKIVLFIFAGRKVNMEVQLPYLLRLLDEWPQMEIHLWDLTRTPGDAAYVNSLHNSHGGRITVINHLHPGHPIRCTQAYPGPRRRGWPRCTCIKHKPPYEEPYRWYAANSMFDNSVFVKVDDDVLFLETDNFAHLIEPLVNHPNRIYSANVANNVVCAKYDDLLAPQIANKFSLGDPLSKENDRRWWGVHTDKNFAAESHEFLLRNTEVLLGWRPTYTRTRPGEAISINCIALTHATMRRLALLMNDRLGDEGAVDRLLPWIVESFHAAHLAFGPQEAAMSEGELAKLRERYSELSGTYLGNTTGELAV